MNLLGIDLAVELAAISTVVVLSAMGVLGYMLWRANVMLRHSLQAAVIAMRELEIKPKCVRCGTRRIPELCVSCDAEIRADELAAKIALLDPTGNGEDEDDEQHHKDQDDQVGVDEHGQALPDD